MLYDDYYGKNVTSMNFPVSVSGASKYVYVNSNIPLEDIDIENTKKLTGIGEVHFQEGDQLVMNDELMGLNIKYQAIHGSDDSIKS